MEKTKDNLSNLAGLKFVALMLILWWHSTFKTPTLDLGARACEFFFVSSGFLVAFSHKNGWNVTWSTTFRYYAKKVVKMWPLHLIMLAVGFFFNIFDNGFNPSDIWYGIINLLCLHAWEPSTTTALKFNGVSWFLSALLFCYFIAPVLYKVLSNTKKKIFIFLLIFAVRIWLEFMDKTALLCIPTHINPLMRSLEFALGMISYLTVSQVKFEKTESFVKSSLIEFFTIVALIAVMGIAVNKIYRGVYVAIFCVVISVFYNRNGIVSKILSNRVFISLSKIQFEIYLTHVMIIKAVAAGIYILKIDRNQIIAGTVSNICLNFGTWLLVILIAWIYKKYIDKYAAKLMTNAVNKTSKFLFDKEAL